jgi:hypothetical protein
VDLSRVRSEFGAVTYFLDVYVWNNWGLKRRCFFFFLGGGLIIIFFKSRPAYPFL